MHDLFALSEVAEPELADRARMFRTRTSRPINLSGYYATPDWVTKRLLCQIVYAG
jgi:hypothetical protein